MTTQREDLLTQISHLEALIKTQQDKYNLATKSLAETQASIAVTKTASQVGHFQLTARDLQEFRHAVNNSVQSVTEALEGLGEMQLALRALKDALIMLPD